MSKHAIFRRLIVMKRNFESIPEGREFMIRSPSPDRIIRTFTQRSLRLGGEPGFRQSTFERLGAKLRDRGA